MRLMALHAPWSLPRASQAVLAAALAGLAACGGEDSLESPQGPGGGSAAVELVPLVSGLSQPVHIAQAGDGSGRLFVVERVGRIRLLKSGTLLEQPFLDIEDRVGSAGSEQGLLSVAFPPGYAGKGYFYVMYTNTAGDSVLARIPVGDDPDLADAGGMQILLTVPQPQANHNGGQLAFGPDGLLYIGLGDGGGSGDPDGNGQNPDTLLGKILRIDVEDGEVPYGIPPSNPFDGEIWALGLRNPWRFSFDRQTGDLYIADVGQNRYEEVDYQPAASAGGQNYGWNVMEGLHCYNASSCDRSGLTLPVAEYSHDQGDCSIAGGFVYRGTLHPELAGVYLFGDYCTGRIWGLSRSGDVWQSRLLATTGVQITSFGEDEQGELYVADYGGGRVLGISVP